MSAPIWFDSTETGAPVLNNAAGSLIALLRAVLVNGFNVKAITSIVVSGGVATATCPAHGYSSAYGKWLEVRGASAPALNGVKQQTIVDANTFTYPAPGVADGTYTATDARRAPLGWEEEFVNGAATVAVYRRTSPEALGARLRVNDTGVAPATATSARALLVYSPTSVDAWSSQAPLESSLSGGVHCNKGSNSTTAKEWLLVGGDRGLWLFTGDPGTTYLIMSLAFFDAKPFRDGDSKATVISGTGTSANTGTSNSSLLNNSSLTTVPSVFSAVIGALSTGIGDPSPVNACGAHISGVFGAGGSITSDADDFVVHRPVYLKDTAAGVRGEIPGFAQLLASNTVVPGLRGVLTTIDGASFLFAKITFGFSGGAAVFSLQDDWY